MARRGLPLDRAVMGRGARRALRTIVLAACLTGLMAPPAPGAAPQLRRYPYLTDAVAGGVTVTWATDQTVATGVLRWGRAGVESCTAHDVTPTRSSFTVGTVPEYQWTARIPTGDDTRFCYRVYADAVDLLDTDPSPEAVTQVPAGSSTPFSFAVFGDWGQARAGGNVEQTGVLQEMARSGARFVVSTGDTAYSSGSQNSYGDLFQTGGNTSGVFGPTYWTVPGRSLPYFPTLGNHGYNSTFLSVWPTENAAAASGGKFAMETYCCVNGTKSKSYPSAWYAFNQGNARFYVLDAAYEAGNLGTGNPYKNDFDYHWKPTSPEYQWLSDDLRAHPSQLKFAFFHYPLYSDHDVEASDTLLQGPDSLEGLLSRNGVAIAFNGHAHLYQRNLKPPGGVVSYVTGGGGAALQIIGRLGCGPLDAYGIGWSFGRGSACGAAAPPTSADQVFHFLLVRVDGTSVTVTPTDSKGRTFDEQTYSFDDGGGDTEPPSAPSGLSASAAGGGVDLSWTAATDNVGVAGYDVVRDDGRTFSVGAVTTYRDTTVAPATAYSYTVKARDAAGHVSAASNVASVTTPPGSGAAAPALVRQATAGGPSATSLTVPIATSRGDALVATIAVGAQTSGLSGVRDSAGNAWSKGPTGFQTGSNTRVEIWYALDTQPVSSVTITKATAARLAANISEYAGVAATNALDAQAGGGSPSATTASTPPLTTSNADDLIVAAASYSGTATSTLTSGSLTGLSSFDGDIQHGRAAYRTVTATGTYQASWSLAPATTAGTAILALKAGSGAGSPDTTPPGAPPDLTASAAGGGVDLTWGAATDDVGVTGYEVIRDDGTPIPVGAALSYRDDAVAPATTYTYKVKARDAAGNLSTASTPATVTTPPAGGGPAPAFVRQASGGTSSATSLTVPISSTAGDALVATIAVGAQTSAIAAVRDSAGNVWNKGPVGLQTGNNTRVEIWYALNAQPVSSVTITKSTASKLAANISELSGVAAANALDAQAGGGNPSTTTPVTPSITTTNPNDVIVGAISYSGTAISMPAPGFFTTLMNFDGDTQHGRAAYRIVSATGTHQAAWSLSPAAPAGGAILALKAA